MRAPPAFDDEDAATAQGADAATAAARERALVTAAVKKRKLCRQVTGTEVPWFPHDNDTELLKELCHEAGRPRWVYFGTPAGGAGIHGCIEMGCSVLALCFDDHHKKHLAPFLVQRAVGAMLGSKTLVFHNESLVARAKLLRLTKDAAKDDKKEDNKEDKKEEQEEEKEEEEENSEEKKEGNKQSKKKAGNTKKKRKPASSSSSDSEPTSEQDTPQKKKKKAKMQKA